MTKARNMAQVTFVVATNSREIRERNFLASPCLRESHGHQIVLQEGFTSAAAAYNDAIDRSANDLVIFVHQDIILPKGWFSDLSATFEQLEIQDPKWGVLGCYGQTQHNEGRGYVYDSALGIIGEPLKQPEPVQTLDEIVLILRKSSGLRFDIGIPHFHMYGSDICLEAALRRMTSYAISAFCIHNTRRELALPTEFYECYRHFKRKWKRSLPIYTPCIQVTQLDWPMYKSRLWEMYETHVRRKEMRDSRVSDTRALLDKVDMFLQRSATDEHHLDPSVVGPVS